MAVRIITYDLDKETTSQDYKDIIAWIKNRSWARLSESSYAIDTQDSPQTIYNALKPYLDDGDHLLILTLTRPYYGIHSKDVIDWLEKKL